jgi:nitrous oxide reductase accessory protein NosL
MAEIIREFDYFQGEKEDTYKWSHDGEYLCKQYRTEKEKEDGTLKVKTGLSVYKLPAMTLLEDSEGNKKSITVDNIHQWTWCTTRNLLIYITMPEEQ